jgi:hypothetical protein
MKNHILFNRVLKVPYTIFNMQRMQYFYFYSCYKMIYYSVETSKYSCSSKRLV